MENPDRITVKIKFINSPENIQRLDKIIKELGGFNVKTYRPNSEIQEYLVPNLEVLKAVEKACESLGFCTWLDSTKAYFVDQSNSPGYTNEDLDW